MNSPLCAGPTPAAAPILAQGVVVVEVFIAQRDAERPLDQLRKPCVPHQIGIAPVRQAAGCRCLLPEAPLGLAQQ